MRKTIWLFSFFLFGIYITGCDNNSLNFDTNELRNYFDTESIGYKLEDNILYISVNNSKLIEKNHNGIPEDLEAYASIGAIIVTSTLPTSQNNFDSIIFSINGQWYSYNTSQVEKIGNYIDLSMKFLRSWEAKEYWIAKSYLSDNLSDEFSNIEMLKQSLGDIIPNKSIKDIKFNSFKIRGDILSVKINSYFKDGSAQTYVFNFLYSNALLKIAGITIP